MKLWIQEWTPEIQRPGIEVGIEKKFGSQNYSMSDVIRK